MSMMRLIHAGLRRMLTYARNVPRLIRIAPSILRDGGHHATTIALVHHAELLKNRRILITGGGSGIGLAIARKALASGATVLITGRNGDKLDKVKASVGHAALKTMIWDVGSIDTLETQLPQAIEALGGEIDALVNNAGILSHTTFPSVSPEDWDDVYAVNSRGLFFLTQAVCRRWIANGGRQTRKILNISSQGGFVGATYPYRLSKWDVAGLTQGLGVALAERNIIVNGIAPGIVTTGMQMNYLKQGDNSYCDLNPARRTASPDEIAELAAFLLGDASNFIVAQTIVCDGGFSVK